MEQELRPLTTEELYEIDGGGFWGCAIAAVGTGVSAATGCVPGVIIGVAGIAADCFD